MTPKWDRKRKKSTHASAHVQDMPQESWHTMIHSDADIVRARQRGRLLTKKIGFRSSEATIVSLVISELARNILGYAREGELILTEINRGELRGIAVMVRDNGPGIADVSLAMQDGFSSSGGLGFGLPAVKRLVDEFEIRSQDGQGTVVIAKKWRQ